MTIEEIKKQLVEKIGESGDQELLEKLLQMMQTGKAGTQEVTGRGNDISPPKFRNQEKENKEVDEWLNGLGRDM